MSKQLHIATSPLTNTIYCGNVLKDGRTWGANKTDVTTPALIAVAEHVINFGNPVVITYKDTGEPAFEISVKKF